MKIKRCAGCGIDAAKPKMFHHAITAKHELEVELKSGGYVVTGFIAPAKMVRDPNKVLEEVGV